MDATYRYYPDQEIDRDLEVIISGREFIESGLGRDIKFLRKRKTGEVRMAEYRIRLRAEQIISELEAGWQDPDAVRVMLKGEEDDGFRVVLDDLWFRLREDRA